MITVGLVKELLYISIVLKTEVRISILRPVPKNLELSVANNILNVLYAGKAIWRERIEGDDAFFGVESCDAISRIINLIDNDNPRWIKYTFFESDSKKNLE